MSDKKRKKKDGGNKGKQNHAMHEAVKERQEHASPPTQQNDEAERNSEFEKASMEENSRANQPG